MKEKVKFTLSWTMPWIAGALFTVGYTGPPPGFEEWSWYEMIGYWLLHYFLWPLILGAELSPK